MKFHLDDFNKVAQLVLDNERYKVYDMKLDHLTVSVTELHPGQETRGHKHDDIEEVYFCKEGMGKIVVGEETMLFERGDVKDLSRKLQEALLMNMFDRREMGRRGREWVTSALSLDRIAQEHEEIYSQ